MSFNSDEYVPVHSTEYKTYFLEIELPTGSGVQTYEVDTLLEYESLISQLLFLNRSTQDCKITLIPNTVPFTAPPSSTVTLDGWSPHLKLVSGDQGFGTDSDLLLTLAHRRNVYDG